MTTVHPRERLHQSRRPFGWIARLYRRTPQIEELGPVSRTTSSISNGAPFLGLGSSAGNSFLINDTSSLRPTISTRPPSVAQSIASNAAVHDVEAISSPVTVIPDSPHTLSRQEDDLNSTLVAPPLLPSGDGHPSPTKDIIAPDTSLVAEQGLALQTLTTSTGVDRETVSAAASQSSKNSAMTSLFTTRTIETQPTVFHLSHRAGSFISSRTGNIGSGANDNASMLTLASSSKGTRRRRNSTDTNCSVLAIAPASARGSFESSRTGATDTRRTGISNPGHLFFPDDGLPSSNRNSRLIPDGLIS